MKIKKTALAEYIFFIAVFLLGLGAHILYIPLLLFYIAMRPEYILKPKIKQDFLTLLFLISLFLIPQYTLGYYNTTLDRPILSMLSVMFALVVFGLIGQQLQVSKVKLMVVFLILGIGIESLIPILYSYITNPYLYGYALLYNPILNKEINSPGAALKIAILASLFVWFLFENKVLFNKIFIIGFIGLLTLLATWLASRAYFVIIGLSFITALSLQLQIKRSLFALIIVVITIAIIPVVLESLDLSVFSRLNRLSGDLDSARFLLWQDGFNKLLSHPMGGFGVDQAIDDVPWFHNIFLDAGRLAGWLPVLGLLLFVTHSFYLFLLKRNEYSAFAGFIFAITFILVQQDVVLEGMIRFVVLLFCCFLALCFYLLGKRNPYQTIFNGELQ